MKNLKGVYYNFPFSHVYVEKEVRDHPRTKRILDRLAGAEVIEIDHYKDVFCRKGQDYILQHRAQNLTLGAKHGKLLYKGARVCQSFGNENFYYTSCVMNCVFDCEYCYLKGMYPSGNLVVFVNLEDIFAEAEKLLLKEELYLCISYDTDLPALEGLTGYVQEWHGFVEKIRFSNEKKDLTVEIRTKAADSRFFEEHAPVSGVIYGMTLSPQSVIEAYEHRTPSLLQRIDWIGQAIAKGYRVRLGFDPMIYCRDWKGQYDSMLEDVFSRIDMEKIEDVSVGTFRVSQDYLKKMRRQQPYSAVVQFPFVNDKGVYHYPRELADEMERFLVGRLKEKITEKRIFLWEDEEM